MMDSGYEVGSAKRRKDKENSKETDKKRTMRYEWQQTESELIIIINLNPNIDVSQVQVKFSDRNCLVKFPDGHKWECELCHPVIPEGTDVHHKGNKLIIKTVKKTPELWNQLQAENSNSQFVTPVINVSNTCEVQHVKHDWYEKANDILVLYIYIKNIKKETLCIEFEEENVTVKFQTSDIKFLNVHKSSDENTLFIWKIIVKELIKPKECIYRLSSGRLEITIKKKIPKRWGSLEASIGQSSTVPNNIWVPVGKNSTTSQSVSSDNSNKQISSKKNDEVEAKQGSPHRSRRSPSRGRDEVIKSSSIPITIGDSYKLSDSVYSYSGNTNLKKPTCMVSPLSKSKQQSQIVTPGLTGLDNLGNTCFMNSVLQCLANTREFRDFFLDGHFQSEINIDNPLGMGGKLAVAFAVLLKVLWSGTQNSYAPSKLKTLIGMKAIQFTGFAQHDAQEFMAFLLDGLHEDLNRIKNKPYTENIDSDGRPDKVVADESWRLYKQRNDSIVVDIFQGQYKSKLVCPVCHKVSITFDPFLYLSVPLPKKKRALPIFYFSKDPCCRPIKYVVMLPQDATVEDLKEKVSHKTGVNPADLRVFEVYKNKFHKILGKGTSLSTVTLNDVIFVFEVLNEKLAGEPVVEFSVVQRIIMPWPVLRCSYCNRDCPPGGTKLKRCTNCYRAGYCNQTCQKYHWVQHKSNCKLTPEFVGCPFIISLPKSKATFSKICQQMEAFSRYSVDVFQPPLQLSASNKGSSTCTSTNSLNEQSDNMKKPEFGSLDSGLSSITHSSCTFSLNNELSLNENDNISQEFDSVRDSDDLTLNPSRDDNSSNRESKISIDAISSTEFMSFEGYEIGNSEDSTDKEKETEDEKDHVSEFSKEDNCLSNIHNASALEPKNEPLIRVVFGKQQETVNTMPPLFNIHPVNQFGQTLAGADGERLKDKGDEPLDLSGYDYLSMDWKNNEKKQSYVLVQSKELEHDYDDQETDFIKTEHSEVTLGQCLQLFTEPEVLTPQEAWYCPRCKEHREATKQLSLWRLPIVLIIQLKRFSFKNLIWRDKIDKMVDFPVRGLDLSPYFCGSVPGVPPIYDLFAVINHHGSILGGHYTASARCVSTQNTRRNEVDWRLFDDSRVMFMPESNVVTKSAYMLFYRQRGVPFTSSNLSSCTKTSNKEQKQRENLLGLDLELGNVLDSNILSYLGEEATEMDTVD